MIAKVYRKKTLPHFLFTIAAQTKNSV